MNKRIRIPPMLAYIAVLIGAIPMLLPLAWTVSTSLKTRDAAGDYPPRWLPERERVSAEFNGRREEVALLFEDGTGMAKVRSSNGEAHLIPSSDILKDSKIEPQWSNYRRILESRDPDSGENFLRFLLNTLLIAGMSVIGQVLTSSMVGWGFARLRFAGKGPLFMIMLGTLMIPGQIAMIPTFMLFRWLGWIDTFLPLIVPAWFGSAFFAFLYRQFFLGIPMEMDEAAKMDGCSAIATYWNILLPLAKPVTVTVAVFTFFNAWNDFLGPLIYLNSDHKRTLSLALAKFQGAYGSDIPALMAAAVVMMIPVLVIYFLSQRALMRGMVITGVKG